MDDPGPSSKRLKPIRLRLRILANQVRSIHVLASLFFERTRSDIKLIRSELRRLVFLACEREILSTSEFKLINNALSLRDMPVSALMTPRVHADIVRKGTTLGEVRDMVGDEAALERWLLIVGDGIDDVEGIVSASAVINTRVARNTPIDSLMEPPLYIPSQINILNALEHMERENAQVAVAIDEHGGVDGLITRQTMLEALLKGRMARSIPHANAVPVIPVSVA